MDFEKKLKSQQRIYKIAMLVMAVVLCLMWFNKGSWPCLVGDLPSNSIMILQYLSLFLSGFAIWYGFYTYDKTASLLKAKENEAEKQDSFLKAKRFQNVLIYIALAIDTLFFAIDNHHEQFAFTAIICLVFCAIAYPTYNRFENDFFEPVYIDDEFNPNEDEGDEPETK